MSCVGCTRPPVDPAKLAEYQKVMEARPAEPGRFFENISKPLTDEQIAVLPVENMIPGPPKDPQPAPEYDLGDGGSPLRPGYSICGASAVGLRTSASPDGKPEKAQDMYHAATRDCMRPGCGVGMCDDHVYKYTFDGEEFDICWRCWRDLKMYEQEKDPDPWIRLIKLDYPELADWFTEQKKMTQSETQDQSRK